jgi:hypothetical protein
MFLQPFLTYTFKNTTSIATNLESTYDFAGTNGWTVPVNVTVGKIFKFGLQLTNLTIGARAHVALRSGDCASPPLSYFPVRAVEGLEGGETAAKI